MLFNGINLNVYEIDEVYVLATSEDAGLEFYARENNEKVEDLEAKYCDMQEDGIHEDCDLEYAIEFITNLKNDTCITVIRYDKFYCLFISFKDYILDNIDSDWFKNIENEPYIIAWSE